jgi:ABC-type polysaccharide/polyol phosphate transport system ATPase subunit
VRRLCTEVIWLHEGQVAMQGEPEAVIEEYTRFLDVRDSDEAQDDA